MAVTWNPADKSPNIDLSNGDLTAAAGVGTGAANDSFRATESISSGKVYWEIEIDDQPLGNYVGIGNSSAPLTDPCGINNGWSYVSTGFKYHGSNYSFGDAYGTGAIIGVALDMDAGKIWFAKDGVWQGSGDPANGTNEAFSGITGTVMPMGTCRQYVSPTSLDKQTIFPSLSSQTYSPPSGFDSLEGLSITCPSPFSVTTSMSVDYVFPGFITLESPFSIATSIQGAPGCYISSAAFSVATAVSSGFPTLTIPLTESFTITCNGNAFLNFICFGKTLETSLGFSCNHSFNTVSLAGICPVPSCEAMAVFRYARLQAEASTPIASFRVGKRIEGECPVPSFTCIAYSGRDPSIIASAPCPTCSMRIGLKFSGDVPIPICSMVADTHHLATIYGRVPVPLITCIGDTENITVISGTVPTPTGLFEVTVGNVASIFGRSPCPYCTMVALTGQVVTLSGRVPVPGSLVRFYASLANDTIILTGTVPTPTMTSSVDCFTSSILRHVRGKIR